MAVALKFLDEETSFNEDLKIVWSLKSFKFVKAFLKTLFRFR
jgi:lycopene beta-cyclase